MTRRNKDILKIAGILISIVSLLITSAWTIAVEFGDVNKRIELNRQRVTGLAEEINILRNENREDHGKLEKYLIELIKK